MLVKLIPNLHVALGMISDCLGVWCRGFVNQKKRRDYPDGNTAVIGQNAKSPGELKWLAVIQTPVKYDQLTRCEKLERNNNNNNKERNRISPNCSTKQRHKNQSYQGDIW